MEVDRPSVPALCSDRLRSSLTRAIGAVGAAMRTPRPSNARLQETPNAPLACGTAIHYEADIVYNAGNPFVVLSNATFAKIV